MSFIFNILLGVLKDFFTQIIFFVACIVCICKEFERLKKWIKQKRNRKVW
jgi:uncharacterized membrane protein YbaN (DUF454 family)